MAEASKVIKRRRDRAFWQQQVVNWQQTALSPGAYASAQQLCPRQFQRWRYKLKRERNLAVAAEALPAAAAFIPLQVTPAADATRHVLVLTGPADLRLEWHVAAGVLPDLVPVIRALLCGR